MTRHILVTAHAVSTAHHEWNATDTLRVSWDVTDLTIELPLLPDDTALRVSLAELRSWATARDAQSQIYDKGVRVCEGNIATKSPFKEAR